VSEEKTLTKKLESEFISIFDKFLKTLPTKRYKDYFYYYDLNNKEKIDQGFQQVDSFMLSKIESLQGNRQEELIYFSKDGKVASYLGERVLDEIKKEINKVKKDFETYKKKRELENKQIFIITSNGNERHFETKSRGPEIEWSIFFLFIVE